MSLYGHQNTCGSGLARDAGNSVYQANRSDAIASKTAPTEAMQLLPLTTYN